MKVLIFPSSLFSAVAARQVQRTTRHWKSGRNGMKVLEQLPRAVLFHLYRVELVRTTLSKVPTLPNQRVGQTRKNVKFQTMVIKACIPSTYVVVKGFIRCSEISKSSLSSYNICLIYMYICILRHLHTASQNPA